jgi:hypothetical protein
MMTPQYQQYLEGVKKKLDRLNKANGVDPASQMNHNQLGAGSHTSPQPDGFNDDVLNIMGNAGMEWLKKNGKI